MRTALWCLAALAGRALAVAQSNDDLISEIASTEEQILELEAELASLLAGSIDSDSNGEDSWGGSDGSWGGSDGSWGGSWDGTTTLSADDCTETSTTTATIVTTTGSTTATLTATVIVVPTTPASSAPVSSGFPVSSNSTPAILSSSGFPVSSNSTPAIPSSSGTAPVTTPATSFLGNTTSSKPYETSYTTYTSLCTENGTIVTHTHSEPIGASATPTQSSYTTFTSLCTENGTVVTHTHSQPVDLSSAPAEASATPSEAIVTDLTTTYTTVCPATSTISTNGTTSEYTYNATSTVTSVISASVPALATSAPSDVLVTDFTTVYTTVCPATSTISKNGTTSESTYITTSTVTSVISTTVPASPTSTASEATVTDLTTIYTTICPATSTISKDGTTSESTYMTTSTVTSVIKSSVPVSPASTSTEYTVTDFTTVYTTVCPATSTISKDGTTSESTYITTSTVTDVYSLTIPVSHTAITGAPTGGAATGGSSSSVNTWDAGFSSLESWWHSWYTSSEGEAATANGGSTYGAATTAEGSSETTIVPVPYGSYTPSSGTWSMATTTMVTDYVTIYTTVCPVTSTGSDGSATTGTTTSTVTSSVHATITTSVITGTPSPSSSAAKQSGITATWGDSPYYPAGNKTSSAAYASGTASVINGTNGTNGTNGANGTNAICPAASNATCVPCAGQPSSNYGNSGDQPFCGLTIDDNSYEMIPQTCQTVEYFWEITNTTIAPDGISREALVINGQMPGPLIEANWGDWIIVHVKNSMQNNGSTVHWHGLRQNYTNEMDGVSSITQCPIAPGESMTYKFRADNYGFSWYHSHFSLQTYEGVFGPIVIHGPDSSGVTVDGDQSFILQDWSHTPVDEMYDASQDVRGGGPRTLDTGLINGMNVWDGAGERFEMTVKPGSTYKFRFVNSAIQSTMKVYLDGHNFTVISADFVPIVPYETSVLSINNGQRYEVLVTFDQEDGSYWLRSDVASECSSVTNGMDIKAIVHYEGNTDTPTSTANSYSTAPGDGCADEPLASLVPYYKLNAHSQDYSIDETVTIGANSQLLFKWSLSGTTFQSQWGDPTLLQIYQNGTVPDYSGQLAITVPDLGEWVYLIIDSPVPFPHPIHLHGHDFYILAQGTGLYSSSVSLNLENPPRRDVAMMPWNPSQGLGGHLVIAWKTDNPGAWLVHCHIGWHIAMGFALQVIEGLDDIACTVKNSDVLVDTCSAWHEWAGDLTPFDSGV